MLEPYLGRTRFITAYLLTGIFASVVSLWWHDNSVSAGASGAIFGMYGVFLAMLTTHIIDKAARGPMLRSIGIFVVYNLAGGMKSGIDSAAHIGGLLSGIGIGYIYCISLGQSQDLKLRYLTVAMLAGIILSCSFIMCSKIPNDIGIFTKKEQAFISNDSRASKPFLAAGTMGDKQINQMIADTSISYATMNVQIARSLSTLDLPTNTS
jgi:rhomboid protease GluP